MFLWSFHLILTILSTALQDRRFTDVETESQTGQGRALLRANLLVLPEDVPLFLALLLTLRYIQVRPWLCVKCNEILYAGSPVSRAYFSPLEIAGLSLQTKW